MDKSLLLVLLSLQVFLLFTVFTSTDAAALMRDPQFLPRLVKRSATEMERPVNRNKGPYVSGDIRPGMFGALGPPGPSRPPPRPRTPPRPEDEVNADIDGLLRFFMNEKS